MPFDKEKRYDEDLEEYFRKLRASEPEHIVEKCTFSGYNAWNAGFKAGMEAAQATAPAPTPSKRVKPKPFITTTQGGVGWFAVQMWWNPEMGGFWEPWTSGLGRYKHEEMAIAEALDWADAEGIDYVPRVTEKAPA